MIFVYNNTIQRFFNNSKAFVSELQISKALENIVSYIWLNKNKVNTMYFKS